MTWTGKEEKYKQIINFITKGKWVQQSSWRGWRKGTRKNPLLLYLGTTTASLGCLRRFKCYRISLCWSAPLWILPSLFCGTDRRKSYILGRRPLQRRQQAGRRPQPQHWRKGKWQERMQVQNVTAVTASLWLTVGGPQGQGQSEDAPFKRRTTLANFIRP